MGRGLNRRCETVHKVALGVQIGRGADDLHRVLAGPHRAVAPQAVEHGPGDVGRLAAAGFLDRQAEVRHVVVNSDRKVPFAAPGRLPQIGEHRLCHRGGELLGRQPVPPANHCRQRPRPVAVGPVLGQRRQHVQIERLAHGARLLGAIQHGDALNRRRQRPHQRGAVERTIQPHRHHPGALAARDAKVHRLGHGPSPRADDHNDVARVGRTMVVEQAVRPTGSRGQLVHRLLHDPRRRQVERVDRLAGLKEHIGILRRPAQHRAIGAQAPRAMFLDQRLVDHLPHVLAGQQLDLVHLVRGAKSVEEMHDRHARTQRGGVGHQRQILGFLHRGGGQHRPTCAARRHHVAVVAEDRQRVGRHGPRGNVKHRRSQLAGNLEHVRQHQQQSLRRRERGAQRPRLQGPMHGGGRARLALHLDHVGDAAENVRPSLAAPVVGQLAHGRRGRDGIDRDDLAAEMGNRGRRLVAVDRRPSRGDIGTRPHMRPVLTRGCRLRRAGGHGPGAPVQPCRLGLHIQHRRTRLGRDLPRLRKRRNIPSSQALAFARVPVRCLA